MAVSRQQCPAHAKFVLSRDLPTHGPKAKLRALEAAGHENRKGPLWVLDFTLVGRHCSEPVPATGCKSILAPCRSSCRTSFCTGFPSVGMLSESSRFFYV